VVRRIPCSEPVPGGCPAYFDHGRLLKRLAHGKDEDTCDECHDIPIQTLLTGIAPTSSQFEALQRLIADLDTSQRSSIKMIRAMQQTHCPSVFTVRPVIRKHPGRNGYVLRLYCEQPNAWHALPGDEGTYKITELDPWLAKYGPAAARVLALIAKAVPVAGAVAGVGSHVLHGRLHQDLEKTRALLARKVPAHVGVLDDPDPRRILLSGASGQPEQAQAHAHRDADFRDLRAMLLTLDPASHWGGLHRVVTPEGVSLYLCGAHAETYE
jgi:hypothetical protein